MSALLAKPQNNRNFIRGVGWSAWLGRARSERRGGVDGVSLRRHRDCRPLQLHRQPKRSGSRAGLKGRRRQANQRGPGLITPTPPSFTPEASAELIFGQLSQRQRNSDDRAARRSTGLLAYRISVTGKTADGYYNNKNDSQNTYRNSRSHQRAGPIPPDAEQGPGGQTQRECHPEGKEMCENCFNFNRPDAGLLRQ